MHLTQNQQSHLALRFEQLDSYVLQLSKLAFIKAQCLHFAENRSAMEAIITETLLSPVSNQFVLDRCGFYYGHLDN
jgi:hypothetical protein